MIRQAAIKNGGRDIQIFDRKSANLAGITLLGTSHWLIILQRGM